MEYTSETRDMRYTTMSSTDFGHTRPNVTLVCSGVLRIRGTKRLILSAPEA